MEEQEMNVDMDYMNFEQALSKMKNGCSVAREYWQDCCIYIPNGQMTEIRITDGKQDEVWRPTTEDLLAHDYVHRMIADEDENNVEWTPDVMPTAEEQREDKVDKVEIGIGDLVRLICNVEDLKKQVKMMNEQLTATLSSYDYMLAGIPVEKFADFVNGYME